MEKHSLAASTLLAIGKNSSLDIERLNLTKSKISNTSFDPVHTCKSLGRSGNIRSQDISLLDIVE
jgi:hypothetical protein